MDENGQTPNVGVLHLYQEGEGADDASIFQIEPRLSDFNTYQRDGACLYINMQ